jgi:hypothetical protein
LQGADDHDAPVRAKAVLIDPVAMTVVWMNESGLQDLSGEEDSVLGLPVEQAMPMAEMLGLPAALRTVADTGVAQHLRTGLVSTVKGSVEIVTSVYRLPDGELLVVTENAWQPLQRSTGGSALRPGHRRTR